MADMAVLSQTPSLVQQRDGAETLLRAAQASALVIDLVRNRLCHNGMLSQEVKAVVVDVLHLIVKNGEAAKEVLRGAGEKEP